MFRSIQIIVSAILLSRPGMPVTEATRYARVLQDEAVKHDYDPFTVVAIVHGETRWRPGLISADGEDYGLGQVRARYMSGCRGDQDPVHHPSAACRAAKWSLLVGENNLRRISTIITANRELCKAKTGAATLPRWLAGYEGYNSPSRERWCKPGPITWRVVDYRKELIAKLAPPPQVKAVAVHTRAAPVTIHAPLPRARGVPGAAPVRTPTKTAMKTVTKGARPARSRPDAERAAPPKR